MTGMTLFSRRNRVLEPVGFANSISLQIRKIGADGRIYAPYAVEAADDEPLRRRNRCGRADAFGNEPSECFVQDRRFRSQCDPAERLEPRRCAGRAPPCQEPGHEPGNHARRHSEKHHAAGRCSNVSHSPRSASFVLRVAGSPKAEKRAGSRSGPLLWRIWTSRRTRRRSRCSRRRSSRPSIRRMRPRTTHRRRHRSLRRSSGPSSCL